MQFGTKNDHSQVFRCLVSFTLNEVIRKTFSEFEMEV